MRKPLLEELAQGICDGSDHKYDYDDICCLILEIEQNILFGCMVTLSLCIVWIYFDITISMAGILMLVWSLILDHILKLDSLEKIRRGE